MISVVVPLRDEAATLRQLHERVTRVLSARRTPFELVLVDDGSRDETACVAAELQRNDARVLLLRCGGQRGKSFALSLGFMHARGEVAVTLDGDLQDRPEMIGRLLDAIDAGCDLVNGRRTVRHDSRARRYLSYAYNTLLRGLFPEIAIHDINCGYKALRRTLYSKLELPAGYHRLIPVLAILDGFRVGEVEVEHDARGAGHSKYPTVRIGGVIDAVSLALTRRDVRRPQREMVRAATVCAGLGLGLAALARRTPSLYGWAAAAATTAVALAVKGARLQRDLQRLRDERDAVHLPREPR